MSQNRSGWAVGWTYFAGFMMIMLGIWHAIAGLSAILKKTIYSTGGQLGDGYFLKFNVSTWGWIHLILGIVIVLAGFALFTGAVWARTVGVILAAEALGETTGAIVFSRFPMESGVRLRPRRGFCCSSASR